MNWMKKVAVALVCLLPLGLQAAKVDTVGVTWGFRPREELEAFTPKLVADSPLQVIDYIKAVNHIE